AFQFKLYSSSCLVRFPLTTEWHSTDLVVRVNREKPFLRLFDVKSINTNNIAAFCLLDSQNGKATHLPSTTFICIAMVLASLLASIPEPLIPE
ncbi:hypothetical protein, partial [Shewanella sp. 125m-1]